MPSGWRPGRSAPAPAVDNLPAGGDPRSGPYPGLVVEGPLLPERVELVMVVPEGELTHLLARGLKSGQLVDRRLTASQLASLRVELEASAISRATLSLPAWVWRPMRLGLAYEYDPYFSLSIARVDPLPASWRRSTTSS